MIKGVVAVQVMVLAVVDITTRMNFSEFENLLIHQSDSCSDEFTRVFHGRGGIYPGWEFITVDSIDAVLNVSIFFEVTEGFLDELKNTLEKVSTSTRWKTVVLQKRYLSGCPSEVLVGSLAKSNVAIENGLSYKLNLLNNRNSGFFPDMKLGREFVARNCFGNKVLNLFAYTCSFSVVAIEAGASVVVNVDMSKGALSIGRENHRINKLATDHVTFMPYNILKSWGRIKKAGPYDLIIIDPPSFQKGSFAATKDYRKIIKRLPELANESCLVLSALNSPDLDSDFIKAIFLEQAPTFKFESRLPEMETFPSKDSERTLKNLIFRQ